MTATVETQIAQELGVRESQVRAAVELLDGGATVPFIARYRKELTGALDDIELRTLEARLAYLRELAERRDAVLDQLRLALIPEATGQTIDQPERLIGRAKQQRSGVRGDGPAIEIGDDGPPFNGCKSHPRRYTLSASGTSSDSLKSFSQNNFRRFRTPMHSDQ